MIRGLHVSVIIPARGGSVRLKRKNIFPVWGRPMLSWAIAACRLSKYIDTVFVSSEDSEILAVAKKYGAVPIIRPSRLAKGNVPKQEAICHGVTWVTHSKKFRKPDIVISLQANSPEIKAEYLDKALEKLLKYKRQEIFSVDRNLNQNAAFRIMTYDTVFQKTLSTNCGVFIADVSDIHTIEDVRLVERRTQAQPSRRSR